MSAPKWTPGPWLYGKTEKGRPKVVDENGFAIATAGAQPYNHDDLRLLAAAPDLYKALVDALEFIELISPLEGPTVRKARAALAKARGEQ